MKDFKIIKCPSCGSSTVEVDAESIATCKHCGTKILLKDNDSIMVFSFISVKQLLVIVTVVTILIAAAVFWITNSKIKVNNPKVKPDTNSLVIEQATEDVPKVITKTVQSFDKEMKSQQQKSEKPHISILSEIKAQTSIGGLYWIIQIRNDEQYTVVRPSVVVSLFDNQKKRIAEQVGWSKSSHLDSHQTTEVLVLISKPPQTSFRAEIAARANNSRSFALRQEYIEIKEFIINTSATNKLKSEIIGDVYNPFEYQVDFVKVVAVAKNDNGKPVGIADAYVTTSSIPAHGQSGFKVTAGTFVAEIPISWSLYAMGSKHRNH